MPDRSKNTRKPWTGVHPPRPSRDRRGGVDRRHNRCGDASALPYGDRRRRAGRRSGDLPRNRWIGLLVAGGLGVLSALAWQAFTRPEPAHVPATVHQVLVPAESMERARALRDEAEALTPTEVLLDEQARERWLPLAAELERTLEREQPAEPLRRELEATLAALQRAGVRH